MTCCHLITTNRELFKGEKGRGCLSVDLAWFFTIKAFHTLSSTFEKFAPCTMIFGSASLSLQELNMLC